MGKKCIPGVLCIENMTLFILFIIIILAVYFYYTLIIKNMDSKNNNSDTKIIVVNSSPNTVSSMNTSGLIQEVPPLRIASPFLVNGGIPINIETRGTTMQYSQVGILTKSGTNSEPLILPLMGRQSQSGRDKWQYYTVSNTGFVNNKLPIRVNGRSCTGEYGCDSIMNGDNIYVEGYDSSFRVTMYDTAQFNYIPYL
jgi:hypothetical protein